MPTESTEISDYERGYINGFYNALKGVEFIVGHDEATVQDVKDGVSEVFAEMRANGEMVHIKKDAETLIELVKEAEKAGVADELFDALELIFGGNK